MNAASTSAMRWFDKTELLRALGKTKAEALGHYAAVHQHFERLIEQARHGISGKTASEQHAQLAASLKSWGANPYNAGDDDKERTWLDASADSLLDPYFDHRSGEYVDVPVEVEIETSALLAGISKEVPPPTVTDAFREYLKENAKTDPYDLRKQQQRFGRVERSVLEILMQDCLVSKVTRINARAWRDKREADGVAVATIKREINEIRAVFSFAF
jgi:hypothetical protein